MHFMHHIIFIEWTIRVTVTQYKRENNMSSERWFAVDSDGSNATSTIQCHQETKQQNGMTKK